MAAYAALVSLLDTTEQIQNHRRLSASLDEKQIQSLREKLDFLLDFVENYSGSEKAEDLERKIASAAHEAEDVIESHIVDQILAGSTEESRPSFLIDLQKIIRDMDSIKEKVTEVKEIWGFEDQQPKSPIPAASLTPLTTGKTTLVGFDGYLVQLLDWLTGEQSDRQIIPITGMGGIGKTKLAMNVYKNPLVVQHFDARAWVTVSQNCDVREILLQTISCLGGSSRGMDDISEDKLGEQVHKSLSRGRYLIVLDDIWSIDAWDKINFSFQIIAIEVELF